MENGGLSLLMVLIHVMLIWCADSLDMTLDVRICITTIICNIVYMQQFKISFIIDGYADMGHYDGFEVEIENGLTIDLKCSGIEFKVVDCNYENSTNYFISQWGVTCKNGMCA